MTIDSVAEEVLAILKVGRYQFQGAVVDFYAQQKKAEEGTSLYSPESLEILTTRGDSAPMVTVLNATSQEAAYEISRQGTGRLALLNFASARNPGGGFLRGAKAQEEDLCRCSGLYPCLLRCMTYYEINRQESSLLYTDYAIFSPDVPFIRTSSKAPFLNTPCYVSVITAPAPNSGPYLAQNPSGHRDIEVTFLRRWQNVFKIAADQGMERLILGAWGCGAFGGDPLVAASTAKRALQSHGIGLKEVVFAIPGTGKQSRHNLESFESVFGNRS